MPKRIDHLEEPLRQLRAHLARWPDARTRTYSAAPETWESAMLYELADAGFIEDAGGGRFRLTSRGWTWRSGPTRRGRPRGFTDRVVFEAEIDGELARADAQRKGATLQESDAARNRAIRRRLRRANPRWHGSATAAAQLVRDRRASWRGTVPGIEVVGRHDMTPAWFEDQIRMVARTVAVGPDAEARMYGQLSTLAEWGEAEDHKRAFLAALKAVSEPGEDGNGPSLLNRVARRMLDFYKQGKP